MDEKQARGIADKLFDDNGNMRGLNAYRRDKSDTFSSILRRMAEEELRATPLNTGGTTGGTTGTGSGGTSKPTTGGSGSQSTSKPTSSGVSTGSGKTTTVVLSNGKQKVSATVADTDETKFINMLQSSKGVS